MTPIVLCRPNVKYESSVLEAISEFQKENAATLEWYYRHTETFSRYVEDLLNRRNMRTEKIVPESIFWAIKDNIFVGRISIRHELNENLRKLGGHIGYEVRPSYRKQGIASEMLKSALSK
jgi:predicted acetyltransferase